MTLEVIPIETAFNYGGMIVGAVAAYFGAMNAMKEKLARLEERIAAVNHIALDAHNHACDAQARIDRIADK